MVNEKLRFFLCRLVIPVLRVIINRIENEVKQSPNPYDDLAMDIVKTVIQFIEEYLCKSE